jgi:toxin ParE1/3/4
MYSVNLHPEAEKHLTNHYLYYEEQLTGLGSEFLLSFEACMNYVQRHPLSCEKKYVNFRMAIIDRFPYGIFYLVNEKRKRILIGGVYFLKINPSKIKKGLRKI